MGIVSIIDTGINDPFNTGGSYYDTAAGLSRLVTNSDPLTPLVIPANTVFCIDFWLYKKSNAAQAGSSADLLTAATSVVLGGKDPTDTQHSAGDFLFGSQGTTTHYFWVLTSSSTSQSVQSAAFTLNTWRHIAIIRPSTDNNNTAIWVAGIPSSPTEISQPIISKSTSELMVGGLDYNGTVRAKSNIFICDIRITVGCHPFPEANGFNNLTVPTERLT
jgi:hypothetical protein